MYMIFKMSFMSYQVITLKPYEWEIAFAHGPQFLFIIKIFLFIQKEGE